MYFEDTTVHLPATISNAKVAKAADEYARLRAELDAEQLRLINLDQARAEAEQADRDAFAAALRSGSDDPGTGAVEQADRAIASSRRRVEALEQAVADSRRALLSTIEAERPRWSDHLQAEATQAAATFASAVEALAAAHDRLTEATTVNNWLRSWSPTARLKPPVVTGRVQALISRNGSAEPWPTVVAALRDHAQATTPTAPKITASV